MSNDENKAIDIAHKLDNLNQKEKIKFLTSELEKVIGKIENLKD